MLTVNISCAFSLTYPTVAGVTIFETFVFGQQQQQKKVYERNYIRRIVGIYLSRITINIFEVKVLSKNKLRIQTQTGIQKE